MKKSEILYNNIKGKENNPYEKLKKKTERLIRLFKEDSNFFMGLANKKKRS